MAGKASLLKQHIIHNLEKETDTPIHTLEKVLGYLPSERTIRNVKKELLQEGYPIKERISDHTIFFDASKAPSTVDTSAYMTSKQAEIRQMLLLQALAQIQSQEHSIEPITQDTLYQKVHLSLYTNYKIASKCFTFQNDLKKLILLNYIEKIGTSYRLLPTAPVFYSGTYQLISDINDQISLFGFSHIRKNELFHIQKILKGSLTRPIAEQATNECFLNGQNITPLALSQVRSILDGIDYENRVLQLNYLSSKNKQPETILFKTQLLYYSYELDSFYLVGLQSFNNCSWSPRILRLDQIQSIQTCNDSHREYCTHNNASNEVLNNFYISLYSYSNSENFAVHITFDLSNDPNHFYRNLLQSYERARKQNSSNNLTHKSLFTPNLELMTETIFEYEDICNNYYEVANFLRRFGERITIQSPKKLSDIIRSSAERTLSRYYLSEKKLGE